MITIEEFKRLELKVGRIVDAQRHPNADRLLVVTVDVGGVEKKVVAGIAQHYDPSQLPGKLVVAVNNLEPATIRGIVSDGMLLVAAQEECLSLLIPDKPVAPGSVIR